MPKSGSNTIGGTKAFRWFNEMQVWDRGRFVQYLESDYFQTRSSVLDTTHALLKVLDQPDVAKAEFFQAVDPGEKYSITRFNERFNHLMEAMRHFVAIDHVIREMDQKPDLQRTHFFKGLKDLSRNAPLHTRKLMWKEYQSQYERIGRKLRETHQPYLLAEVEDHFCETYSEANDNIGSKKTKNSSPEPQDLIERKMVAWDKAYYVERMRNCAILMSRRTRQSFSYSIGWKEQLDQVKVMLRSNPATAHFSDDPQVKFYEEFIELMHETLKSSSRDPDGLRIDHESASELCKIANENPAIFEEDPHAYGLYSNVLIHLANLGHERFYPFYFDLNYHLLVKGKILDSNRKIPAATFRNTVILGYRLGGQYASYADTLMDKLRNDLSFVYNERANLLKLCKAWKYFYRKEYAEVYRRCEEIDLEHPLLKMQIADMGFRSAFSAAIGMDMAGLAHLDFWEKMKELQKLLARLGHTRYGIVRSVGIKMPLYVILMEIADGKTGIAEKMVLREDFKKKLADADLPGHERAWLEGAFSKIT